MDGEMLDARDRSRAAPLFTPATVTPPPRRLSRLRTLAAMHRNLLEAIDAELFNLPFRQSRSLGRDYLAVCDPELIQAVLLDHADAFGRSELQQRGFRPSVGEASSWPRAPPGEGSGRPPRPPSATSRCAG
jgi:hypothetical protein